MTSTTDTLNRGWQLQKSGRVREAELIYQQVLAAQPTNPDAWCYLGIALHDQQRYSDALFAYRRALELRPEFPVALNNLGNTFRLTRRLDEAIATFDKALEQKPDYVIAYKNKATTLCWEGRVADALAVYEQAVQYAPADADIHKHIGIMSLLLGDFVRGWPEYEWRWKTGEIKLPEISVPRWDGSSLDGKSILLTPEQGLGDTIHFIRYAAWLKAHYNCRVLFHCPRVLKQLLSTCAGIDEMFTSASEAPPVDTFAPLLHIPSVLGHTPADFPAQVPYISTDEALVNQWRDRLAAFSGRKIGIAWRGSPTHQADIMRSIPLAEFAAFLPLKGVHFFSLQKGKPAEELNTLAGRLDIADLGRDLDEKTGAFVETAAVMKNLDLVIACDTAIAHVAGALGVPVWVALCNVADWRWLATGETTAWYPTMRLFRQTEQGNWGGVMNQIAAALRERFPDVRDKEPADYVVATSGFNRLTRTRDGLILYDRQDLRYGRYLDRYGQYAVREVELLEQAVQPGWTVVEAGAGIGLRTLPLSRRVGPKGFVLAFEHGPLVFQTLCANVALNSITNVRCHNEILTDSPGTVLVTPQHAEPREGEAPAETIRAITLDSLNLPRCNFLKIDMDGLELRALEGGRKTIEKFRPLLHIAANRAESSPPLIEFLQSLGYSLFWHTPTLFDDDNFYHNPHNEFGHAIAVHILGIHSSVATDISGLKKIDNPSSTWRN